MTYKWEDVINVCWSPGPRYGFRIIFPLLSLLRDFTRFIPHTDFHDITRSHDIDEVADADKVQMNPQHFGSDPVDIRIRMRINPETGFG